MVRYCVTMAGRLTGIALLATALAACSGGWFGSDLPEGTVPASDVAYPNINNAPDRPSDLKTEEEQAAMEQEMEELSEERVTSTERRIETQNRRQ